MNKVFSIAAIVALVTTLSFAQGVSIGVRTSINMYGTSSGPGFDEIFMNEEKGLGFGFSGGLLAIIPLSDNDLGFAIRTGAEFSYRGLYDDKITIGLMTYKEQASEFAISIPVMIEYGKIRTGWVGVGLQLDIPFSSKLTVEASGNSETIDFKDRSSVDLGVIINGGFHFTNNIAIDLRGTIAGAALTKLTSNNEDKRSLYQLSLGLIYIL